MKKMLFTLAFAAISCTTLFAQNMPEPQKKQRKPITIEKQVNRMANQLMLDDATAAKFAPLYKEYLESLQGCCAQSCCKNTAACPKSNATLTDKEIEARIEKRFEMQQQRLDIQKKYFDKFKKILNAKQLEKVFAPRPKMAKKMICPKAPKGDPMGKYCPQGGPVVKDFQIKK